MYSNGSYLSEYLYLKWFVRLSSTITSMWHPTWFEFRRWACIWIFWPYIKLTGLSKYDVMMNNCNKISRENLENAIFMELLISIAGLKMQLETTYSVKSNFIFHIIFQFHTRRYIFLSLIIFILGLSLTICCSSLVLHLRKINTSHMMVQT